MRASPLALVLASLAFLGGPAAAPVSGQIQILEALGYVESGPGIVIWTQEEGQDGTAPAATAAPGQVAQQLAQQPLQRSLDAVLGARRELALTPEPGPEELEAWKPPQRAARIRKLALAGYWEELGARLPDLAPGEGGPIYDWLLAQLAASDEALLPGELEPLILAAPSELDFAKREALGRVLGRALGRGGVHGLVARLEAGIGALGGTDPEARSRAADLLFAADLPRAGLPFLEPLPAEGEPAAPSLLLERHARLHAALAAAAAEAGETLDEARAALRAFELLEAAFAAEDADPPARQRIVGTMLAVMRRLPEERAQRWLASIFDAQPALGEVALAAAGDEVFQLAKRNADPAARARALIALRELVTRLEETAPDLAPWAVPLGLVGLAYQAEARRLLDQPRAPAGQEQWYFPQQQRQVPLESLLEAAPGERWIAAVDGGLGLELSEAVVRLAARAGDEQRAFAIIRNASARAWPDIDALGRKLVEELARALDASQQLPRTMGGSSSFVMIGNTWVSANDAMSFGLSVPVPRARQRASLERLGRVLRELDELGLEPVPPAILVKTFAACHSPAEVYRRLDIETTFGPLDELDAGPALALVREMRSKLSGRWRAPATQDRSGTRRTEEEVAEEVERGYTLARDLVERARRADPEGWEPLMEAASVTFDLAEFRHASDPSLERYAPLREEAFQSYGEAARRYLTLLAAGTQPRTAQPFLQWFDSALGASELGYLTRETQPDHDQVELLRRALAQAPPEHLERLSGLFSEGVQTAFSRVSPEVKPRYLRHAMRVLEDHPASRELARIDELYRALTEELALHVEIDGPAEIGTAEPFGLHIALRYTTALDREGGGFDKFLRNKVNNPLIGAQVDHLDDFERRLHRTLEEHFELHALSFHAPGVAARGFGRHGWLEKPLGYALLSARDPSVDRIPALALDVDFSDGKGAAILPVSSPVVLVDATRSAGARPVEEASAALTLDARELAEGILRLEVRASAKGVLPDLDGLLEGLDEVPGFERTEVLDHGLNVASLDAESHPPRPLVERSFDVELRAVPGSRAAARFSFPSAKLAGLELELSRYADLDIVPAGAVVDLDPSLLPRGSAWLAVGLVPVVLTGLGLWIGRRRRRARVGPEDLEWQLPVHLTPLGAIALLRRVEALDGRLLDAADRSELARQVEDLERAYFGPNGVQPPADLHDLLEPWLARARAARG